MDELAETGTSRTTAAELVAEGTTQFLTGHPDEAVRSLQRAHRLDVAEGRVAQAVHSAFLLGTIFNRLGEQSLFEGWLGRAQRLLPAVSSADGVVPPERGYVAMLELHRALRRGRFDVVSALAQEVTALGLRHHDRDLCALGVLSQGRLTIYAGDVAGGLALLDEAVAAVLAGEVGPLTAGVVYCTAIEGCQEIGAVDRLCRWTDALITWCEGQPGLQAFAGACALHHGQVSALRGDWDQALIEFTQAAMRYLHQNEPGGAGAAYREVADLLRQRGDLPGAQQAYQRAVDLGCDPQPGLALLWVAQDRRTAASAALHRWLTETTVPVQRCPGLLSAVEVLLAVDDLPGATEVAGELDSLAQGIGSESVIAAAAQAHAAVELAGGDPAATLPYARKAIQLWGAVGAVVAMAHARLLLAQALDTLGDHESAAPEYAAATLALGALGVPSPDRGPAGISSTGPADRLTPREIEVLRLVAAGSSNRQIARTLVLSERTVARHISNIFGKLDVASRTAAASYAYRHHLM